MERIRAAAAIFSLLLLLQIVRSVRKEHIRVEYSMAWFLAALLLLGLSLSDAALSWISRLLGVSEPSFVLLVVAGLLFLFTFFRFSIQVSDLKDHNIVQAQRIGMLEWEVKQQAEELRRLKNQQEGQTGGRSSGSPE